MELGRATAWTACSNAPAPTPPRPGPGPARPGRPPRADLRPGRRRRRHHHRHGRGMKEALNADMTVVSNASCTTNCLAPVAKIWPTASASSRPDDHHPRLHQRPGDRGRPPQGPAPRPLAAANIIPTKTGPPRMSAWCCRNWSARSTGFALRVPTINVSLVDLTFTAERATTKEEINALMTAEGQRPAQGHPGGQHRAAGVLRLQPHHRLLHLRRHPDPRHPGRTAPCWSRCWPGTTTVGLLLPHARRSPRLRAT